VDVPWCPDRVSSANQTLSHSSERAATDVLVSGPSLKASCASGQVLQRVGLGILRVVDSRPRATSQRPRAGLATAVEIARTARVPLGRSLPGRRSIERISTSGRGLFHCIEYATAESPVPSKGRVQPTWAPGRAAGTDWRYSSTSTSERTGIAASLPSA